VHKLIVLREAGAGAEKIAALLAPDVVFKSPVLSRSIEGRERVAEAMVAAIAVREGAYIAEMADGPVTLLVWRGQVDGLPLDSFEMLVHDNAGLIVERTVAMRPFASALRFRNAFYERMKDRLGIEYFALPDASSSVEQSGIAEGAHDRVVHGDVAASARDQLGAGDRGIDGCAA
jgi:hypothetical protein